MRKRIIKKSFYISYEESELLEHKCRQVGMSMSELIRCFIRGFVPKEKPGKDFYDEIKNLRMIGNNLNQLTKYANTTGKLKEVEIIKLNNIIEEFIIELKRKFLSKDEINIITNIDNS